MPKLIQPPSKNELYQYLNLHTNKETARYFGVSIASIDRWIKKHDLTRIDKDLVLEHYNKIALPPLEEFKIKYCALPAHEVAKYYGVSEGTICNWRKELDIEKKGPRGQPVRDLPESLTSQQLQLVIGSLLGDGCLRKTTGPLENSYYTEQHGPDQYGYLQYKSKLLEPFSNDLKPKSNYRVIYLGGKKYEIDRNQIRTSFVYNTFSSPIFTALERKWYRRDENGSYKYARKGSVLCRIKQIPDDIELTPFVVAIWYFDDGHSRWRNDKRYFEHTKRGRGRARNINLCTQGFTLNECEELVDMLKSMGITDCRTTKSGEVGIYSKSFVDFVDMVKPFLPHPCLKYKVEYEQNS